MCNSKRKFLSLFFFLLLRPSQRVRMLTTENSFAKYCSFLFQNNPSKRSLVPAQNEVLDGYYVFFRRKRGKMCLDN